MTQIKRIKKMYYSKGKNIKEIIKDTGHNYRTIVKYLEEDDFNAKTKKEGKGGRTRQIDSVIPIIDKWCICQLKFRPQDMRGFNKDFTLNRKEAVESFERIVSTPVKSVKINKDLLSPEKEGQGEEKLKQMLSR